MDPLVLIGADGNFKDIKFSDSGLNVPVSVVSIMGVQGTGKSTLLNSCFSTDFPVLDHTHGTNQTTKGIYTALCSSPRNTLLVLDIEGTDSKARGRVDNNAFESQTTLFALAMSNTVIFNMKCDNLSLHNGSSSPLLKTVLEAMVRKFSPPRRINLLFVLRDRNKCTPEVLKEQVEKLLKEIWDGMPKPCGKLDDYFNVEVLILSHYDHKRELFDEEVAEMRERIFSLVEEGQLDSVSGFMALAERNWKDIKEDKILNIMSTRISVAEAVCTRNVQEKFRMFREDKKWLQIQWEIKSGIVEGFGSHVSSILDRFLFKYDEETLYLEQRPRNQQRYQLTQFLLKDVEQPYLSLLDKMRAISCAKFQKEIVEKIRRGCCNFEKSKRNECISQFKNLLSGAHIKQANWDYMTDKQLEKLEKEMTSNEEAASYIIEIQKKIKELETKRTMVRLAIYIIGGAAIGFGVGAVDVGVGVGVGAQVGPICGIAYYSRKIMEKKSLLKEACKDDPIMQALVNQI